MTGFGCPCHFRTLAFAAAATAFLLLPAGAQTRGGTLTIGIEEQVVGFDPVITRATTYATLMVGGMIFGTPLALLQVPALHRDAMALMLGVELSITFAFLSRPSQHG
jgi:hypothetical protein